MPSLDSIEKPRPGPVDPDLGINFVDNIWYLGLGAGSAESVV